MQIFAKKSTAEHIIKTLSKQTLKLCSIRIKLKNIWNENLQKAEQKPLIASSMFLIFLRTAISRSLKDSGINKELFLFARSFDFDQHPHHFFMFNAFLLLHQSLLRRNWSRKAEKFQKNKRSKKINQPRQPFAPQTLFFWTFWIFTWKITWRKDIDKNDIASDKIHLLCPPPHKKTRLCQKTLLYR